MACRFAEYGGAMMNFCTGIITAENIIGEIGGSNLSRLDMFVQD
jgi:hypothetical protein